MVYAGGRATHRLSQGFSKSNVIDHGYFLKPMQMNPYIGTVHDGVSTEYNKGFAKKHIHWLARFRYNILPQGKKLGFYSVNPGGKHVHYLEVSTWRKIKVQLFGEEASPMLHLAVVVVTYSIWHGIKTLFHHPDMSFYNIALWTTKPWVQQFRFNKKYRIDQPSWRYMVRCPELFVEDPQRDLIALGVAANDPFIEYCKDHKRMDDLLVRKWGKGANNSNQPKIFPITDLPHEKSGSHAPTALSVQLNTPIRPH